MKWTKNEDYRRKLVSELGLKWPLLLLDNNEIIKRELFWALLGTLPHADQ